MADGIDVPINLPTESASVRAAMSVVKGLEANLAALGPAAAAGSAQASASMRSIGAAADAARSQVAALKAQEAARAAMPRGPSRGPAEDKARAQIEAAAGKAAIKAIDDDRRAASASAAAAAKADAKSLADAEKAAAKEAQAAIKAKAAAEKAAAKEAEAAIKAKAKAEEKASKDAAREVAKNEKAKASAAKKATEAAEDARKRHVSSNAAAVDATGQAIAQIGAVAAAVAAAVLAAAAAFSYALVRTQAFKEATVSAFGKLLGGAKAGEEAFKKTIVAADEIGISYRDALSGVNSLVAKGFGADQAILLVKAMADLKSVVPDANISNLLLAISQIKSKGVLQMEELQGQIAEAGLSVSVVLEEIGKKIGKSAAEVRKMISAGKISADQGVAGILAAIQKATGKPIGDAAKEASMSLGGLLARLEQIPEGLLMAADASKGMGVLKDVLANVNAAFAPSTAGGKAMAAALGTLGDALAGVLGGLTGVKGKSNLETFALGTAKAITMVADGIRMVTPHLPAIAKGLLGIGAVVAIIAAPIVMLGALVGGAIFAVVAGFSALVDFLSGVTDPVANFFTSLYGSIATAATGVYNAAIGIGTSLTQGIVAGLAGGLPSLLGAVASVALATTGAAKTGFKTASPSKVWRDEIGYQLPAGGAIGIKKGGPLMVRAAGGLASNTNAAARGATGGGGAGAGRTIVVEAVHFHGMARGDADFFDARMRGVLAEWAAA